MTDLWQQAGDGLYYNDGGLGYDVTTQDPQRNPYDDNYVAKQAWAGALADISKMFMGQAPTGQGVNAAALARRQREQFNNQQRSNADSDWRKNYMDRDLEARTDIANRRTAASLQGGGGNSIGSPQKLENGNIGVVTYDPSAPGGYTVVDTGTEYRGDPNLEEKLGYEQKLYELKEKSKYQSVMGESEAAWTSADTALSGLYRAKSLLNKGVETGTFSAVFAPEMWKDDKMQEMTALINEAVLKESEKMSGVLSESDMKFLKGATISQEKSPAANQEILDRKIAILEQAKRESKRKFNHFQGGGNFFDWEPVWNAMEGGDSRKSIEEIKKEAGLE